MKSLSISKAITVLAVLLLAAPVSAGRLDNNRDAHRDFHVEWSSGYHFAGSGKLTSPLTADCLDSPDGYILKGEGTTSQMFVTGPLSPLDPPTWTSEVSILWANSIPIIAGGVCAPVNGTITDNFPDGSTLTAKVAGWACTMASLTEGVPPLPCICYLSAMVVEGTGQCEGAKGVAKITSYIDADGKITMIGTGTLKLANTVTISEE